MIKLFKKAIVFTITASFVFSSGLGQILSYALTSEIYKTEKAIASNFEVENISQANYSVATANTVSTSSDSLTFENFTYTVYNSEIIITGYTGQDTEITIPSKINGMKVTTIEECAFYGCSSLKSITIPAGVTSIGNAAFEGCSALESITIPEGVASIEYSVFYGCSALESIIIPKGVTSIKNFAFYGCSSLKSITFPDSLTYIGECVFQGCSSLEGITLPDGVTYIGSYTFERCSALESITIPKGITSIKDHVFTDCSSLKSITLPEGLTSIGESAFYRCSSLESITIPKGVTSIENSLFLGCSALKSITLPEGVISIGKSAFSGCSALKSITIPKGVTSIGESTFYECSSLESITLPEGVTSIAGGAFGYCSALKSITLPEGVTSIGGSTFWGCSSLTDITIPEGVTSIENYTFYECSSLTGITLPEGVASIGTYAFYRCSALKSITIPKGVTSIGTYAFLGCSNLTMYVYKDSVSETYAIDNNITYKYRDDEDVVITSITFDADNGTENIVKTVGKGQQLNYTPEAPTKTGYTFVGWYKDTDDITTEYKSGATYDQDTTYKAKWAHVEMLGAQVKAVVDDKSGIRFGTKIYNDGDEIVEKGTIILPLKLLPEGESLTLDTPNIAQSVGKINYEVNEEKNYVTYLGTLVNIPRVQFDAEITASAYVIYKDKAGNEYTVYATYKKGSTTINKLLNN